MTRGGATSLARTDGRTIGRTDGRTVERMTGAEYNEPRRERPRGGSAAREGLASGRWCGGAPGDEGASNPAPLGAVTRKAASAFILIGARPGRRAAWLRGAQGHELFFFFFHACRSRRRPRPSSRARGPSDNLRIHCKRDGQDEWPTGVIVVSERCDAPS